MAESTEYRDDYWKLGDMEDRFNTIQAGVRGLSSAWMLAAFSGVALLLQFSGDSDWLLPPFVLVSVVCLLAIVGLLVLWMVDQFVYQRLLGSAFLAALTLEHFHDDLPAVRTMMLKSSGGMSRYLRFYYFIPIAVFLALATCSSLLHLAGNQYGAILKSPLTVGVMLILILIVLTFSVWVFALTKKVGTRSLAKELSIEDLETVVEDTELQATLRNKLAMLIARSARGPNE